MSAKLLDVIEKIKIIPVVKIESVGDVSNICEALKEGGLPVLEITLRSPVAFEAMRLAVRNFPDLIIGAGTVITVEELRKVYDTGVKFAVSPGLSRKLVEKATMLSFPYFPGVATPSEVQAGFELGCKVMKFFPAEGMGGIKIIKAIYTPLAHLGIQFIPTGGINTENMIDYLREPAVIAVGGSWIVKAEFIAGKNWGNISKNARNTVEKIKDCLGN